MMKKLLLLLFLLLPIKAHAIIIDIQVEGLVCDFCAQSIWKTFMLQRETEHVYVDLENGIVEIIVDKDISNEKINKLLEDAGYTVSNITRK